MVVPGVLQQIEQGGFGKRLRSAAELDKMVHERKEVLTEAHRQYLARAQRGSRGAERSAKSTIEGWFRLVLR